MKTSRTLLLLLATALGACALCSSLFAATHDQDPRVVSRSAPVYSFDLRKTEFEGAVLVSFNITARGDVTDAIVVRSTSWVFDEPTLNAIRKWKFTPAMKEGRPVDLPTMQLVTFTASGRKPETRTIELVQKLKIREPSRGIEIVKGSSHDPCFCGSGKNAAACHGVSAPRHLPKHASLLASSSSR